MQEGDLCTICKTNPVYRKVHWGPPWCSACLIDTMNDVECVFCDKPVAARVGKEQRNDNICCETCVIHLSLDAAKMRLTTSRRNPELVAKRTLEIEQVKQRLHGASKRSRNEKDDD